MNITNYTHRVAVNAFLVCKDKFLLLKRTREPFIWAPPGGHLELDEDPVTGLKREVLEETCISVFVHQPVTTWFGEFNNSKLLSIDYLCTAKQENVVLSSEHHEYLWLSMEELNKAPGTYFNSEFGFQLADFSLAWQTYLTKTVK